jgi:polyphenol oxidase
VTPAWLVPEWPAPGRVRAASAFRLGGVSPPPWDSLNLGEHVGDEAARVAENRARLSGALGLISEPAWLAQVHGREVLRLDDAALPSNRVADGAVTGRGGRTLAVLTADCLPVAFCTIDGTRIGIAHAGWRGLAAGVLEATCAALEAPEAEVLAWIGPGIGAAAYEVGADVRDACLAASPPELAAADCFTPARPGHWQFDLAGLAQRRLEALGLRGVYGGRWCTHSDPARFYSHRRDGRDRPTGRMATLIWIEDGLGG